MHFVIVACVCVDAIPVIVIMANVFPPLVLVAPAPVCLLAVSSDMLDEALAPLHCCGIAEPKLLL